MSASSKSTRSHRSIWSWSTSIRSTRRSRARGRPRRGDRTDRHRRTVDAPFGRKEFPPQGRDRQPGPVRRSSAGTAGTERHRQRRDLLRARARGLPSHRGVRRRDRRLSRAHRRSGTRLPAAFQVVRTARDWTSGTARTRTSRRRCTAHWSRSSTKLHGKELSFNNIIDMSRRGAARGGVRRADGRHRQAHESRAASAPAPTLAEAYERAFATDTTSPFGGIVAVNRPLDMAAAERINEIFTEVIIAPAFPDDVLEFLRKKKDRRLITRPTAISAQRRDPDVRSVPGGFLVQEPDVAPAGGRRIPRRHAARTHGRRERARCASPGGSPSM